MELVADTHRGDADPDPAFHLANPDLTFQFDADSDPDPDPTFHFDLDPDPLQNDASLQPLATDRRRFQSKPPRFFVSLLNSKLFS
jgi:hypothetical protein